MNSIEKALEKAKKNERKQKNKIEKGFFKKKQNNDAIPSIIKSIHGSEFQDKQTNEKLVDNVKTNTNTSNIFPINRENLSKQGYLCAKNGNSQLSEEYRMIKRPLINNALHVQKNEISRANLILVTSSQPGEGKTFTALNLALSIARERDNKALLIDADVAKPSISKVLGISEDKQGLIDYLDGKEQDFSQILIKTDISGLSFVPAGIKHGYSTELLASNAMAVLVEELHSRYPDRIVIFDSPPLLATTQAEVLAGLVGQVVLVVEAERTAQSMVFDSINKLKVCDIVLPMLNKSTHTMGLNYYDYGQYGH